MKTDLELIQILIDNINDLHYTSGLCSLVKNLRFKNIIIINKLEESALLNIINSYPPQLFFNRENYDKSYYFKPGEKKDRIDYLKCLYDLFEINSEQKKINQKENIFKRLRKVYENNISLQKPLEEEFPELKDNRILTDSKHPILFIKKNNTDIFLYLYYDIKSNHFKIKNLKWNKDWDSSIAPSMVKDPHNYKYYLITYHSFNKLLKTSGTNLDEIIILNNDKIKYVIHKIKEKDGAALWEQ